MTVSSPEFFLDAYFYFDYTDMPLLPLPPLLYLKLLLFYLAPAATELFNRLLDRD